ncbi:MAG: ribosome biogenesis GTPase Der [Patescibacteria group bacterium]|nr:ribosome biogenesis GTPase Der [Patescibacteria group bacterium]
MEDQPKLTPVIALVGRTNVGKSTLFNRLIEQRKAITSSFEGTTRDINFGHCHWRDQVVTVIDTAGLDLTTKRATDENLIRQAQAGMDKADIVLLMVDIKSGLMPQDVALAKRLRKSKKKVLLIANKADNPGLRRKSAGEEWMKLGIGEPLALSAANGSGVGDMLDVVLEELKKDGLTSKPFPEPDVRVAIIGRPNVGKSSLLNALAGEERVIVSEVPHTTKEPQDTMLTYIEEDGTEKHILLIDTVGIRKKGKVGKGIEKLGVSLSIDELVGADVAFLMLDATEGIGVQERKLAGLIEKKNCGVLVIVNKWDLSDEHELGTADEYRKTVPRELPFYTFAPIAFISAKTGNRVGRLLKYALDIAHERTREISDKELEAFLERMKKKHGHVIGNKKDSNRPKIYGIKQVGVKPPTFMVVGRKKEKFHPNFLNFIENRLREDFGFEGTPIAVVSREIQARAR